ncbi:NAD(P)-dependent dehydrogenase (short-subunit alcohol dehydrogenase family) [Bradyrhizobium sp. LB9.1b]
MYNYAGNVAIVTGAAMGIGRAIATKLASEGCHVILWDKNTAVLEQTFSELQRSGASVAKAVIDVTDLAKVKSGLADVVKAHGAVDILVNNAGTGQVASIIDDEPEDFEFTMKLNVTGTFNCCHAVVPAMIARKSGRIINISSWFGKVGRPSSLAYCASKFAILGMTQSMGLDLAAHGIRVNAVCPGAIANTHMRQVADEQLVAKGLPTAAERAHTIPLGRLGEPEDIANVVAFLLSDQASYMTGQGINVTGGLWMN